MKYYPLKTDDGYLWACKGFEHNKESHYILPFNIYEMLLDFRYKDNLHQYKAYTTYEKGIQALKFALEAISLVIENYSNIKEQE